MNRLVIVCALLLASCGSRMDLVPGDNVVKTPALEVSATWIKDKGERYDIELNLRNTSDKDAIVMLGDMDCLRGEKVGILKHTFFNTGERTINLLIGQLKTFRLVCNLNISTEGDFKIKIRRMFANPSSDGKTTGKVIAKDIVWTYTKGK